MGVKVEVLRIFSDARGSVFEPLEPEALTGWQNVHAVITEPGAVRGNHLHGHGTEVTTLLGPALVRYRNGGRAEEIHVPPNECWRLTFPPGIAHAFKNTGSRPLVLVSFNTHRHDPDHPDVVRDVLIES